MINFKKHPKGFYYKTLSGTQVETGYRDIVFLRNRYFTNFNCRSKSTALKRKKSSYCFKRAFAFRSNVGSRKGFNHSKQE